MIPDLQSSIICDDVRQERNGKFLLIGVFDLIASPTFPMVFQRLCIVNRWCCGSGTFTELTRVVGADGAKLGEGKPIPVVLSSPENFATNIQVFMNVQIPAEGLYWVEILLDNELKLRYPLRANRIPAPPSTPGVEPMATPGNN